MSTEHNEPSAVAENLDYETRKRADSVIGGKPMSFYLQPDHIAAVSGGYPEAARPHLRWLADYCRESCRSDHKILAQHSRQGKHSVSHQYLYAIFRGTYNLSGPAALADFLQLVASLKAYAESNRVTERAIFAETPAWEEFAAAVVSRRKAHVRNRLVFVSGGTGSGKTALLREFQARHAGEMPIYYIPSPERPSQRAWEPAMCSLFGVPFSGDPELRKEALLRQPKRGDVLLLDDAHRLYREKAGTNQPAWNFIQRLHDETEAVIVVSITELFTETVRKLPFFAQFLGRAGGRGNLIEMPPSPERRDVVAIAEAYGLRDAKTHAAALLAAAGDSERLRPLQDALAFARADAGERFTFAALEPFLPAPRAAKN